MKIAYLAAGAAGMYCGTCLHDNTLCATMLQQGEDVLLVPLYTPLRTDEESVSLDRVFLGGVNLYLRQRVTVFRALPNWITRPLDWPWLLNLLTRHAGGSEAADLGQLTVAMLRDDTGYPRDETARIRDWLAEDVKPDVVHLGNALLTGMAPALRWTARAPIVCSLGGEDSFVEKTAEPYRSQIRELLRDRCRSVDAFVAMNRYYANFMADYLSVESKKIHVIPHGLQLEAFESSGSPSPDITTDMGKTGGTSRTDRTHRSVRTDCLEKTRPQTVGFLARICHDKGLHTLVEAFIQLASDPALPEVRLQAAGYLARSDGPYLESVRRLLKKRGLADRFEYLGELNRTQKIDFLWSLDVMALPTTWPEAKGISVLESMAAGVPVVAPDHGSFPEIVGETQSGLLHQPGAPESLAAALRQVLLDPEMASRMGTAGREAVAQRYHASQMAQKTLELYQRLVETEPR